MGGNLGCGGQALIRDWLILLDHVELVNEPVDEGMNRLRTLKYTFVNGLASCYPNCPESDRKLHEESMR